MNEKTITIVDCHKCIYYFVTWDKNFPKGCKLFGFKGRKLPSQSVFEASGEKCGCFVQKEMKK